MSSTAATEAVSAFESLVERSIKAWDSLWWVGPPEDMQDGCRLATTRLRAYNNLDEFLVGRAFWFFQRREFFLTQTRMPRWSREHLDNHVVLPMAGGFVNNQDCFFLSHFWHTRAEPDPDGRDFAFMQAELRTQKWTYVWADWSCMPQYPRDEFEAYYFEKSLAMLPTLVRDCAFMWIFPDFRPKAWVLFEVAVWFLTHSGAFVPTDDIRPYFDHVKEMYSTGVRHVIEKYSYRSAVESDFKFLFSYLEFLVVLRQIKIPFSSIHTLLDMVDGSTSIGNMNFYNADADHNTLTVNLWSGKVKYKDLERSFSPFASYKEMKLLETPAIRQPHLEGAPVSQSALFRRTTQLTSVSSTEKNTKSETRLGFRGFMKQVFSRRNPNWRGKMPETSAQIAPSVDISTLPSYVRADHEVVVQNVVEWDNPSSTPQQISAADWQGRDIEALGSQDMLRKHYTSAEANAGNFKDQQARESTSTQNSKVTMLDDKEQKKIDLANGVMAWANLNDDIHWMAHILHCLDVICIWFGDLEKAKEALGARRAVVLGAGRGEMSIVLAYFIGCRHEHGIANADGLVISVEQPEYAEAHLSDIAQWQQHFSDARVGQYIRWEKRLPYTYLWDKLDMVDYMVLSHPHIDLMSYNLERFMAVCRDWCQQVPLKRLLLAHWTKHHSTKAALAHAHALGAQEHSVRYRTKRWFNQSDGVIRNALDRSGWREMSSGWIRTPTLDHVAIKDVELAFALAHVDETKDDFLQQDLTWIKECMDIYGDRVKCIDVWASSWAITLERAE